MGVPMYVICHFSLAAFNILSLSLIFVSLITMCLGVLLLGFFLPGALCASWTWFSVSFPLLGKESECHSVMPSYLQPLDCTVHGILQARILEWVAVPFSRASSQPRDQTCVSHIAGSFFTSWATREAPHYGRFQLLSLKILSQVLSLSLFSLGPL